MTQPTPSMPDLGATPPSGSIAIASTLVNPREDSPRGLRRWIRMLTAGCALSFVAIAGGLSAANVASAANSGSVMCANQSTVVGVWVQVSGGTSGWASRSGSGYYNFWSYNTQGRPYILTVGCGGSPARWGSSSSTPFYSTNWSNVTCFPGGSYGFGSIYVYNRCYGS